MVRMIRRRRLLKKLVVMLSLVKKGKAMLRMIRRRRLLKKLVVTLRILKTRSSDLIPKIMC